MADSRSLGGQPIISVLFGTEHFVSRKYTGQGDISYSVTPTIIVSESTPTLPFNRGASVDIVFRYSHWVTPILGDAGNFRIDNTEAVVVGGLFESTITITSLQDNISDGDIINQLIITFDDMSIVTLTITQRDAAHITAVQGVVGGIASITPTASYLGTGFSVRVTGEELATFRLTETDSGNLAAINTTTIYQIPIGETTLDIPVIVLENDTSFTRSFSVGATNTVITTETVSEITVNQGADSVPVLNLSVPVSLFYGTVFNATGIVTGGNAPFSSIISRDSGLANPFSTRTGASVSFPIIENTEIAGNSRLYYGQTTDTDGMQHDISPVDSVTANFIALAVSGTSGSPTIEWDVTTVNIFWVSSYGAMGSWSVPAVQRGVASTPVYNNVAARWESTITFTPAEINSGVVSRTSAFSLNYTNGSFTSNGLSAFGVIHTARPLALCEIVGGAPSLSSTDTQAVFTVQYDVTQSITAIVDASTTDTDYLTINTFNQVAATAPTGNINAVGGGTIPAIYGQRRQITLAGSANTANGDRSDAITVQIS